MIITLSNGQVIDTAKDLDAAERHILQKLFIWGEMAKTVEEFREKAGLALKTGWNKSGPVKWKSQLRLILQGS